MAAKEYPVVAILIPTYKRPVVVCDAIGALLQNLKYSGKFIFLLGVDGGWEDTKDCIIDRIKNKWTGVDLPDDAKEGDHVIRLLFGPRIFGKGPQGLGANLNMLIKYATTVCDCDLMLQMDDDHILNKPLYLDKHVKHLCDNDNAGWIRLMGIGAHTYRAVLRGIYWYVEWAVAGPYGLYIPSNRPHLKHRRFHDYYGMYPVNVSLGSTEENFCHKCMDKAKANEDEPGPFVLIPLEHRHEHGWDHVGKSWQGRE